jgi:hypothetical protein
MGIKISEIFMRLQYIHKLGYHVYRRIRDDVADCYYGCRESEIRGKELEEMSWASVWLDQDTWGRNEMEAVVKNQYRVIYFEWLGGMRTSCHDHVINKVYWSAMIRGRTVLTMSQYRENKTVFMPRCLYRARGFI